MVTKPTNKISTIFQYMINFVLFMEETI